MKNILVLAYAVSPCRGSEYSVAWNYITNMAKNNRLTVLFGCSGDHLGDFDEMEAYIEKQPVKNVTFIPVYPDKLTNRLNWMNKHRIFVYSFYFAYNSWLKLAYRAATGLIEHEHFDLVHFLNPISYREPGYLWKLRLPYMWGPICGANTIPWVLFKNLSVLGKFRYGFHNIANSIQLHTKKRIRRALRNTDLLLAATTENRDIFKRIYGVECGYLPENCLTEPAILNEAKFDIAQKKINLIFVGRLDFGKNLTMLLHSLQKVKDKNRIHLDVVGDGPVRQILEKQTVDFGLEDIVTFHGKLPRNEAVQMFNDSHLHVLTSIGEANTTVFFEAMSCGVPTLSLDHCGMHDTIKETTGYKVPLANRYEEMVKGITATLNHVISNPDELHKKALAIMEDSKNYQWKERVLFFEKCYDECITKHNQSR